MEASFERLYEHENASHLISVRWNIHARTMYDCFATDKSIYDVLRTTHVV